jgi:HPt (histidine-containing phosphotransfer) domain-containing protein
MDVRTRADEIRHRLADIAGPGPGPAERALLARLIRSFAGKTPDGVEVLARLIRGGDRAAIRDHAHGLKGSASNIGADTLAAIFAEVEHAARDGIPVDAEVTLARIAAEQAIVLSVMDEILASLAVVPDQ